VSSSVGSIIKTPGQPQVCVSQATMATCKGPAAVAGTAASLVSAPSSISGKATVSGKCHDTPSPSFSLDNDVHILYSISLNKPDIFPDGYFVKAHSVSG
jgi:hypothetical protein